MCTHLVMSHAELSPLHLQLTAAPQLPLSASVTPLVASPLNSCLKPLTLESLTTQDSLRAHKTSQHMTPALRKSHSSHCLLTNYLLLLNFTYHAHAWLLPDLLEQEITKTEPVWQSKADSKISRRNMPCWDVTSRTDERHSLTFISLEKVTKTFPRFWIWELSKNRENVGQWWTFLGVSSQPKHSKSTTQQGGHTWAQDNNRRAEGFTQLSQCPWFNQETGKKCHQWESSMGKVNTQSSFLTC